MSATAQGQGPSTSGGDANMTYIPASVPVPANGAGAGGTGAAAAGPWHPPVPSMASLPVDRTKTEPKPAYYKLQFGDDLTGFSYYVLTLAVMIGRNCERAAPVPPPAITAPSVPQIPPLDPNQPSPPIFQQPDFALQPSTSISPPIDLGDSILTTPPVVDPFSPSEQPSTSIPPESRSASASLAPEATQIPHPLASEWDVHYDDDPHLDFKEEDVSALAELAEAVKIEQGIMENVEMAESQLQDIFQQDPSADIALEEDMTYPPEVKVELTDLPPPPPPPPPPTKSSAPTEHVDVDLGPLKSVSRNHAKIEYRTDLGHFCLEIYGRNGAWVDDRYYVKGSIVPLAQGSQIQIATRIFSFILPPSPLSSPTYTHYALDGTAADGSHSLEDLPYPYNLPPNQVGYQEFYGEAGPGPSSAASMAARAPPAFNAFAAADGFGLGIEGIAEQDWDEDDSDDDSDDDDDGWADSYDEVDDAYEEGDVGEELQQHPESLMEDKSKPKTKSKAHTGITPGGEESELSSVSSEHEKEEGDKKPGKKSKKSAGTTKTKQQTVAIAPAPAPAPDSAAPVASGTIESRRESVAESAVDESGAEGKKAAAKTTSKASKSKVTQAGTPKTAKSKKKNAKAADEAMDVDGEASQPPTLAAAVITGAEADTAPTVTPTKSKPKKVKAPPTVEPATGEEDVKPVVPKKEAKKKVKAEPGKQLTASIPPISPAPSAQSTTPVPTLAVALASTPTSTPTPPPPRPPAPIAPQQPTVRPTVAVAPAGPSVQPGQPGLTTAQPPHGPQPTHPMPPRPPMQPGVRPPPGHPHPQSFSHPHPHPQGQHPGHAVRPPHTPGQVMPLNMQGRQMTQTPPPSVVTSPQPILPFYCTELIETPDRPGHIIVNVPIPPSGAGPRPPPGPILGLDGKPFIGPPPLKPTSTFATIIHRALQYLPRGRGTLGEVCNWVAGEWEWFRLNVDSGWQNSIRHNLSLNKAFLKVPRIPEDDPESKGSVWIIDPEEGPLFEEKQRKDAAKSASKDKNAESRREKERIRAEERAKKQREAAIEAARHPQPPIQRAMPIPPRPMVRPILQQAPAAPPAPPAPVSANAKGVLQPKAKIVVVMQPITPAMRAKSVISTTDANGNPLPFVCDGTTLVLDQQTFGHLTTDILDKLTLLGAAGAVDVLSAWVINKNKQQATKAAQAAQAKGSATGTPAAAVKNGAVNGTVARPMNGVAANTQARPAPAQSKGPTAPVAAPIVKPAGGTAPAVNTNTTAAKPAVPSGANVNAAAKPLPGPAPPGTSLTKVIGMIAAVANAKGDVNTVGPNASALLRYIRVVGVDIDLRVAERIWATGVVPPLPPKKGVPPKPAAGAVAGAGTKPIVAAPGQTRSQVPTTAPATTPNNAATAPATVSATAAVTAGVKRKLESDTASTPSQTPAPTVANGAAVPKAAATVMPPTSAPAPAPSPSVEQDAKKPRLEASSA